MLRLIFILGVGFFAELAKASVPCWILLDAWNFETSLIRKVRDAVSVPLFRKNGWKKIEAQGYRFGLLSVPFREADGRITERKLQSVYQVDGILQNGHPVTMIVMRPRLEAKIAPNQSSQPIYVYVFGREDKTIFVSEVGTLGDLALKPAPAFHDLISNPSYGPRINEIENNNGTWEIPSTYKNYRRESESLDGFA